MALGASPLARIRRLLDADTADLVTLLVYAMFVGLLTLALPIAVQALVNTVAFGALIQPIVVLSALLFAGLTFSATIRAFESWVVERLQQRLFVRVALRYAGRLTSTTSGATDSTAREELLNRFFDVAVAHKAIAVLVADGLAITLQVSIGTIALAFYHPWFLAFGLLLACALALVFFGLGRNAIRTSVAESSAKYETAAWLEELARRPAIFRGAGAKLAGERTESVVRTWLSERRAHFRVVFRQHLGLLSIQVLSSVGLLAAGGMLVVSRQLTIGQLIAAELIVSALAVGVGKLAKSLDSAYDLVTAAEKLAHVEEALAPEPEGTVEPGAEARGSSLELNNVRLVSGDRALLDGAQLSLAPGERIAIIGRSGAGKSALLDLVHGDWDGEPPGGAVEIDRVDARAWQRLALRQRVALIRSGELFAGTIEDNVALGRDGVGPVEVQRALELVGVWRSIASAQDGMSRVLRSGGAPLPPGEALLVVLARALAGDARLLLVDSLADLDPGQRAHVLRLLHDRTRPQSVLFVASDRSLVGPCDRFYAIEEAALSDCTPTNVEFAA